jgi:hypothetical protein
MHLCAACLCHTPLLGAAAAHRCAYPHTATQRRLPPGSACRPTTAAAAVPTVCRGGTRLCGFSAAVWRDEGFASAGVGSRHGPYCFAGFQLMCGSQPLPTKAHTHTLHVLCQHAHGPVMCSFRQRRDSSDCHALTSWVLGCVVSALLVSLLLHTRSLCYTAGVYCGCSTRQPSPGLHRTCTHV